MSKAMTGLGVVVLAAAAAGFLGGLLGGALRGSDAPERAGPRADASVAAEIADLKAHLKAYLDGRLAEVARSRAAEGGGGGAPAAVEAPAPEAAPDAPAAPANDPVPAAAKKVLDGLMEGTFTNQDANRLFNRLTRDKDAIDATVAQLKRLAKEDPRNPEVQVALATALVAKLANDTIPGPQQGIIWGEAVRAYDQAIALEPNHWQARFGKHYGASMAPEFAGLRPSAIRGLEDLMEMQEGGAPAPEQVEVYARLGTLYKDAGNVDKARKLWERGLKRFPGNERITEMIALLEEK